LHLVVGEVSLLGHLGHERLSECLVRDVLHAHRVLEFFFVHQHCYKHKEKVKCKFASEKTAQERKTYGKEEYWQLT